MRGFVALSLSEIPSRLMNTVNTPLLLRFRVVGLMESFADNGVSSITGAVALIMTFFRAWLSLRLGSVWSRAVMLTLLIFSPDVLKAVTSVRLVNVAFFSWGMFQV